MEPQSNEEAGMLGRRQDRDPTGVEAARGREDLPHLVALVEHAIRDRANLALGPLGLTIRQLIALEIVSRVPGITGVELARQLLVTRQTINAVVGDLAARGAITRTAPASGRSIPLALTPQGRALLERAQQVAAEVRDTIFGVLDVEELQALELSLRKVLSSAQTSEAP
jgi:DNA-binding MarR family transcriptional regulator